MVPTEIANDDNRNIFMNLREVNCSTENCCITIEYFIGKTIAHKIL